MTPLRQSYIVGSGKLVPESFEAQAQLNSIPIGEKVDVVIYRDRYPSFDALVYSTFNKIGEAMRWRARNVRGWLAIKTGRADMVVWPPFKPPGGYGPPGQLVPHGTGPADMNRAELEAFWDDAREVIRTEVLPYLETAEEREQIMGRLNENL